MINIGTVEYNMNNFDQDLHQCKKCGKNKVFIRTYINVFQFNSLPMYPKGKHAVAICRGCNAKIEYGADTNLSMKMDEAIDKIKAPKWFYLGAILYPSTILAVILFIVAIE